MNPEHHPLRHRLRTPHLGGAGGGLALALLLAAPHGFAQEALRNLATLEPPGLRQNPDQYTFKTGDFILLVTPSLGTEWNDNVFTSRNNKKSDLIVRPTLQLDASYPVTAHNLLSLNVGLGYDYYLDNDDLSTWRLLAGSAIAFDIFVQDYWINLHNRFSYTQDAAQEAAVAGTADYATFNNMAGLLVTRHMNDITASLGYDHETVRSQTSQFNSEDRASELFTGRAGFRVHPEMTTGFEVTGSFTRYKEPVLNDNKGFSVGPYLEYQPGKYFQVTLRGGYSAYYFENTSQSVTTEDVNSWYLGLTLTHNITEGVSYSVDLGRDVRLGIESDLTQSFHVRPGVNWRATDLVTVRSTFSYEHGEQGLGNVTGNFQEIYDWFTWGVGMSYHVMTRLTASLDYRLTLRSSDDPLREYTQNTITLNFNYQVL